MVKMDVPWKGTWRNFWRRHILKACFREGLDNHLYVFLSPGNYSTSVAQYTNYVLWLDGSDFVVEEMDKERARETIQSLSRLHLTFPVLPTP